MSRFKFVASIPQPLKTLYILFFIAFAAALVSIPLGVPDIARWSFAALGIVAVLLGLCLASNLNGSASATANYLKRSKRMGIDYSRTFLASTGYARFFGGFFALVGLILTVVAFTRSGII
ncbi:hypothetical protein M1E17_18405 [Arthrobacter sp. D1-29]